MASTPSTATDGFVVYEAQSGVTTYWSRRAGNGDRQFSITTTENEGKRATATTIDAKAISSDQSHITASTWANRHSRTTLNGDRQ
eukprot:1275932-Amphidinium_carterae.2